MSALLARCELCLPSQEMLKVQRDFDVREMRCISRTKGMLLVLAAKPQSNPEHLF